MTGIPFTIRRHAPGEDLVDEVVYLRSRRVGAAGDQMRAAMQAYRAKTAEQMRLAAKTARRAEAAGTVTDVAELERIEQELSDAMQRSQECGEVAMASAMTIARLSLQENYPDEAAERILDGLTDRELHAIVATLELGQMPKDFFGAPATQPKPSATGPSGA